MLEVAMLIVIGLFVTFAAGTRLELAAPLVFGVAVWLFAFERGAISVALRSPPINGLGLISYSIYMVHALVIALTHRAMTVLESLWQTQLTVAVERNGTALRQIAFGDVWTMDLVVLAYLLAVIGVAALTWRFVEMPGQQLFNGASAANMPRAMMPPLPAGSPSEASTKSASTTPAAAKPVSARDAV